MHEINNNFSFLMFFLQNMGLSKDPNDPEWIYQDYIRSCSTIGYDDNELHGEDTEVEDDNDHHDSDDDDDEPVVGSS